MRQTERGNILFLILLAVILFAALSYAVTSSIRGGGTDASPEKSRTSAAEIVNYATQLEQTVIRLRLSNNCKLNEISFENPVVSGYANNTNPRADKTCNVFDMAGGGMSWKTPDASWIVDSATADTYGASGVHRTALYGRFNFPWTVCIYRVGTGICDGGADTKELIVGLAYLKKDICDAINAQLGETTNNTAEPSAYPAGDAGLFRGSFYALGQYASGYATGKRTGCIYSTRSGYSFYHVLEAQ